MHDNCRQPGHKTMQDLTYFATWEAGQVLYFVPTTRLLAPVGAERHVLLEPQQSSQSCKLPTFRAAAAHNAGASGRSALASYVRLSAAWSFAHADTQARGLLQCQRPTRLATRNSNPAYLIMPFNKCMMHGAPRAAPRSCVRPSIWIQPHEQTTNPRACRCRHSVAEADAPKCCNRTVSIQLLRASDTHGRRHGCLWIRT